MCVCVFMNVRVAWKLHSSILRRFVRVDGERAVEIREKGERSQEAKRER